MGERERTCLTLNEDTLKTLRDLSDSLDLPMSRFVDLAINDARRFEILSESIQAEKSGKEV